MDPDTPLPVEQNTPESLVPRATFTSPGATNDSDDSTAGVHLATDHCLAGLPEPEVMEEQIQRMTYEMPPKKVAQAMMSCQPIPEDDATDDEMAEFMVKFWTKLTLAHEEHKKETGTEGPDPTTGDHTTPTATSKLVLVDDEETARQMVHPDNEEEEEEEQEPSTSEPTPHGVTGDIGTSGDDTASKYAQGPDATNSDTNKAEPLSNLELAKRQSAAWASMVSNTWKTLPQAIRDMAPPEVHAAFYRDLRMVLGAWDVNAPDTVTCYGLVLRRNKERFTTNTLAEQAEDDEAGTVTTTQTTGQVNVTTNTTTSTATTGETGTSGMSASTTTALVKETTKDLAGVNQDTYKEVQVLQPYDYLIHEGDVVLAYVPKDREILGKAMTLVAIHYPHATKWIDPLVLTRDVLAAD
jgi:hypothetical protein